MSILEVYSKNYNNPDDINIKNDYETIVNSVNSLFNNSWDSFRSKLIDFYRTNPMNVYMIIRGLTFSVGYGLNLAGEDSFFGNKIREIAKNRDLTIEDIPESYKEAFSKINGLMDAFNLLKNCEFKEGSIGEVITLDDIINTSSDRLMEYPSILFEKPFSVYTGKEDFYDFITAKEPKDIESYVDKIKPFFEFYKNNGVSESIKIISNFQNYLKKKSINVNKRGRQDIKISTLTFSNFLGMIDNENLQKDLFSKNALEDNNENLISGLIKYFNNELTYEHKFTKDQEEKIEVYQKQEIFDFIKKGNQLNPDSVKLRNKPLNKGEQKILLTKLGNIETLRKNEAEIENLSLKIKGLKEDVKSNNGKESLIYDEIDCYIELGNLCRLFDEDHLKRLKHYWSEIKTKIDDYKGDFDKGLLEKHFESAVFTNDEKKAINNSIFEVINCYNYNKLIDSINQVINDDDEIKRILELNPPVSIKKNDGVNKIKKEFLTFEQLYSIVKDDFIDRFEKDEDLSKAIKTAVLIKNSGLDSNTVKQLIRGIDQKYPIKETINYYSLMLKEEDTSKIVRLEEQLEAYKQELVDNKNNLNKLKKANESCFCNNDELTGIINELNEKNFLLEKKIKEYEKREFINSQKSFLTNFKIV